MALSVVLIRPRRELPQTSELPQAQRWAATPPSVHQLPEKHVREQLGAYATPLHIENCYQGYR
jgi:hypothetical protein